MLQLDASRRAVEDAAREKDLAEKKIIRLEKAKLAEGKGKQWMIKIQHGCEAGKRISEVFQSNKLSLS